MSQNPRQDYVTSGEAYWAVEDFAALSKALGVKPAELTDWHDEFAGQGRAWEIIRRLYRVAPLVGSLEEDDIREWTKQELADKWGVAPAVIDSEIKGAAKRWHLRKQERAASGEVNRLISEDELKSLTRFSEGEGLDEDTIARLLDSLNFKQVTDPALRAEVANRIVSLKSWLSDSHTRVSAREVIRMEISMHGAETRMLHWQTRMEEEIQNAEAGKNDPAFMREKSEKAIENAREKLDDADKTLRQLTKDHSALLKHLGADELDMAARKRIFVETATYLIDRCREYESNPENINADGVFTAAEIHWLTEPLGERDPQYRPDISVRVAEALQPENLWNPDYVPTPIQRQVQRTLLGMVKRVHATRKDVPEDEDTPDTGWREDDDDDAISDDESAVSTSVAAILPDPTGEGTPAPRPWTGGPSADTGPAAGFF